MPIINPDLSDTGPIEGGTYKAKIVECEAGISKAGGGKIMPKFEIDVNGTKKTRQQHLPYTGGGAFGFDALLCACHLAEVADKFKVKGEKPSFDTDILIGQEVMVVVEPDIYNGQPSDKIQGYLPA